MASKGKTVAGASGVTVAASSGVRCRHYSGLRERFRIGEEYEIIDAKESDSILVNKPGCLILSVDHLEAGFRLPLPEVAKALLNTWGVSPIQLTPNTWRYICIFGVVCKLKEIRGSADVFRAHFKLSASRASGADIYYAKHRTDWMHIGLSNRYSNNKGWMDRLFFVRHRSGAEWGFPTVMRSARKDSFPHLIQDEAKASDKLLRAGVRNGEGYVTEFMLVKYRLSKPWTAAELEAGRDQEENDEFAEKIPVLAHMVFEGDDAAAVARVPSAVRVGAAVTTALVAPSPSGGRPAKAQAPEKGPGKIRLKKKATREVVAAGVRASPAEDGGVSRPSASTRKRPVLVDESAEEAEQLRARKKQKVVLTTPLRDEEGTEEEEDGAQLVLRRTSRAVQPADEGVPWVASTEHLEVAQGMATELGLVVVSDGSGSPAMEEARGSTCSRDREPSNASRAGGAEHGAASDTAGASSRRNREDEESPVRREEVVDVTEVSAPAGVVLGGVVVAAPTTILSSEREVAPAAGATEKAAAMTRASDEVATAVSAAGAIEKTAATTRASEDIAASPGGTGGEAAGAARAEGSEGDRRPLSEVLLKRLPGAPSVAVLEATLRQMEETPRELPASPTASRLDRLARCLELPSEQTPEKSAEGYQPECQIEDGLSDVDVEVLADEMSKSLGTLKALAVRGQRQKYLYEAQTAFCNDLSARHKARETALEEEVKNLKAALHAAKLDVTLARAEKDALAGVMVNVEARAIADYKAGPEYKEDLEQYGARCYRVGLNAGKEVGEQLSWVERPREAFEAAVRECRRRTQDARLDGVRFAQFQSGRMPPSDDDAGEDIATAGLALASEHFAHSARSGELHLLVERRGYCFDSPDQTSAKNSIVSRHVVDDQKVDNFGHSFRSRSQGNRKVNPSHGLDRNSRKAEKWRVYRGELIGSQSHEDKTVVSQDIGGTSIIYQNPAHVTVVDGGRNDQRIRVWGRNPYKIFVREGYSLLGLCACGTGRIWGRPNSRRPVYDMHSPCVIASASSAFSTRAEGSRDHVHLLPIGLVVDRLLGSAVSASGALFVPAHE
ncbi:hypothetical protein Taro_007967, partial [Colocasia esculenta]|nr:hypothetical protein [Colocasia esculenta]